MDIAVPEALLFQGVNVLRWYLYSLSILFWILGLVLFKSSLYYQTYLEDTFLISGYSILVQEFALLLIMVVAYAVFWPIWLRIGPKLSAKFNYEWCWVIRTIWKLVKIGMFGLFVYDINHIPKRKKYSTMDLYLLHASLSFAVVSMLVRQIVHPGRFVNLEGSLVDMAVGIALCMPDQYKLKWGKWTIITTAIAVIILTFSGDYMKHVHRRRRVPPPP